METDNETYSGTPTGTTIYITINPDLNELSKQVLFPEKLAKANEILKKAGLPKPTKKKSK